LPQAPQFFASAAGLMQPSPQLSCPEGQTQAPMLHVSLVAQALPHVPQFAGSLPTSTQAGAHALRPAAQVAAQTPTLQTWPEGQAVPQAPQFAGSWPGSTQLPPQASWPAPQVTPPSLPEPSPVAPSPASTPSPSPGATSPDCGPPPSPCRPTTARPLQPTVKEARTTSKARDRIEDASVGVRASLPARRCWQGR
jgi:hypothetical protein